MNTQHSLLQKLILPLMILIMIGTGILIFKNNPEIMSQHTLLSVLKKHAQDNQLQYQTQYDNSGFLHSPAPAPAPLRHMTIRLKQDLFLPVSAQDVAATDEFSDSLYGTTILAHDNTTIYALSSDTSKPLWRFQAPAATQFAPGRLAAIGSEVIAATTAGGLYSFQITTGQLLWYWQESETFARMPLVYKSQLLLVRKPEHKKNWVLELFDPARRVVTAKVAKLTSPLANTPLVSGHFLIIATQDGHLKAIDLKNKKVKWSNEGSSNFTCPPVALGQHIFICDDDGYVLDYNLKTGHREGNINVETVIESPLAATTVLPYAAGVAQSGDLVMLDLRQRKRLWRYALGTVNKNLRLAQMMLSWQSLKFLDFHSTIAGWTVWANCHVGSICVFDLKTGELLHRFETGHPIVGDFLVTGDSQFWVPVKNGNQIGFERFSEPPPPTAKSSSN